MLVVYRVDDLLHGRAAHVFRDPLPDSHVVAKAELVLTGNVCAVTGEAACDIGFMTITGILRKSGLDFISCRASLPSFFGILRSSRIMPGNNSL